MLVSNLNVLMEKRNITLSELSKETGIKVSTLERYKNNTIKKIYFLTANKLCKALDCDITELFSKE